MFVAFNYKEYGSIRITDDSFLTVVGSCGAIFNGFGRLVFGMLFDHFSFKVLSTIINSVLLAFAIILPFLADSKPMFLIAVCLIYFVYGANYSIYPTQTMRVFGTTVGSKVYFIIFIGFSVGNYFYIKVAWFNGCLDYSLFQRVILSTDSESVSTYLLDWIWGP